jgi:hypothetical protein
MLYRKPRVGQEIGSYCGKCKDERTHIITAMDGDVVRRVTCSTCNGTHNYKPVGASTAATRPAKTITGRASTGRESKRSKQADVFSIDPSRPVKSYDMNNAFSVGDVITHPKFGLGAVESSTSPNKIEVRFQEGKKILLHNMKRS